jgi:quinol monooxygenase YgiN
MDALPGKGSEFARARAPRHAEARKEPGCEQYDLFQNTENPDQLLLVERWTDQASLDAHAELNRQRGPVGAELRAGPGRPERFIVD